MKLHKEYADPRSRYLSFQFFKIDPESYTLTRPVFIEYFTMLSMRVYSNSAITCGYLSPDYGTAEREITTYAALLFDRYMSYKHLKRKP